MEANIVKNVIPVSRQFENRIIIDVPNGWDDVKKICKKVLEFNGNNYVFTGWNSDRNEAFFRMSEKFATII